MAEWVIYMNVETWAVRTGRKYQNKKMPADNKRNSELIDSYEVE